MRQKIDGRLIGRSTAVTVCRGAVARGRSDAVFVGLSAAALWGMPIPPVAAAAIEHGNVSVSRGAQDRAWRGRGIDGHAIEIPTDHVTEVESLTVTTPARTWLDCAALVGPDHLLAMGDWAVDEGHAAPEDLLAMIDWGRGRRGIARARQVAPLVRQGVESPQESRLRWVVVANGLPEPAINPEIVLPDLQVRRIDLAYLGLRIGLEFDGDWHVETQQHDEVRRASLMACGWEIVVARKDDLSQPDRVLRELRDAMARRGAALRRRW